MQIIEIQNKNQIKSILKRVGVSSQGIDILSNKAISYCIKISNVKNQTACILKQEMLSIGGDVAVHKDVVKYVSNKTHDCVLMGTLKQYNILIKKLQNQPYGLKDISIKLKNILASYAKEPCIKGMRSLKGTKAPLVIGILNITPDSFYDGGKYTLVDSALKYAEQMVQDGADIIDIGGESSRPGAKPVLLAEEHKRVIPVIKNIKKRFKIHVSVDTYKASIAKAAIDNGANIINDISSLRFDKHMASVIAKSDAPVVLMHMLGTPRTMQNKPKYKDVILDILRFFENRIDFALKKGIKKENIILDPGLGFGKTVAHNLEILNRISELKSLGLPLLVGPSHKSFIGHVLNVGIDERLEGTLGVVAYLALKNIQIVRVHDVKQAKRVIGIIQAIK